MYSPYPRRLESLTVCWCNDKGSIFSSVILRPWVLVRPESNLRPPAWQPHAQPTEPLVRCSSVGFWEHSVSFLLILSTTESFHLFYVVVVLALCLWKDIKVTQRNDLWKDRLGAVGGQVWFKGSNGMFCLKYIIAGAAFTPLQAYLFSRLTRKNKCKKQKWAEHVTKIHLCPKINVIEGMLNLDKCN